MNPIVDRRKLPTADTKDTLVTLNFPYGKNMM